MMEKFKKELKALLKKHNATISIGQDENDSFLYLNLELNSEEDSNYQKETIDSGYKCISIQSQDL